LAVSLIPGSLIIDADPDRRTLTVHVLYSSPRSSNAFVAEVQAQEQRFLAALSWGVGRAKRTGGKTS
jgi:multicomponent Na+:H+ antiporter subunit E